MTFRRPSRTFSFIATVTLLALPAFGAAKGPDQLPDPNGKSDAEQRTSKNAHFDPVIKDIGGWTVHVDPKLLEGEHAEAGARALTMLANHLQRIAILMPEDRLENIRKVGIWIEYDHREINTEPGPYHPDVDWLTARGYDARLAKKVHVTRAASLLERHHMIKHPAVILHELAHAYHDQFLGFDEPRIKAAYAKAMKAGLYDEVLLYTGQKVRAYAANNHLDRGVFLPQRLLPVRAGGTQAARSRTARPAGRHLGSVEVTSQTHAQ